LIVIVDGNIHRNLFDNHLAFKGQNMKIFNLSFLVYFFLGGNLIKKMFFYCAGWSKHTWEIIFDTHLTFQAAKGQNIENIHSCRFFVIADVNTLRHSVDIHVDIFSRYMTPALLCRMHINIPIIIDWYEVYLSLNGCE
jgi:hypothetical protein